MPYKINPNTGLPDYYEEDGGAVTSVFTRVGDVVAETNDYTWAQIDKTISDIVDITTKSHTSLSDIGTNTHATIDTHIDSDTTVHASATNLLHTTGDETKSSGILTFSTLPQSSVTPTADSELTRKGYVDTLKSSTSARASCRVATTTALPSCVYDNGSSGVGATLTASLNGALSAQDGITLIVGDSILVKDQLAGLQNGIYTVTVIGDLSTKWVLTRRTDYDQASVSEVCNGSFTPITGGLTLGNTQWMLTTTGTITIGTTSLDFTKLSGGNVYTGSLGVELVVQDFRADLLLNGGLELTGNELGVNVDDSSIELSVGSLAVKALGVTNAMLAGSIADSKLNQITTASKVSGAAVTLLPSLPSAAGLVPTANLGTGTADTTTFLRGDQSWQTGTGGEAETMVMLETDRSTTSTSFGDCTGLSFGVPTPIRYVVDAYIIYTTAATTTGINLACNGPASPTLVVGRTTTNTAATTIAGRAFRNFNQSGGAFTAALSSYNIAIMNIIVYPSGVGTFIIRFASEVSGSTVTIKAGSFIRYRGITN